MLTAVNCCRRLKVNFTVINDKDNALLLKCHREVEEAFEKERWSLVSKAMMKEGTEIYVVRMLCDERIQALSRGEWTDEKMQPEVLSRQFKKLMQQGANLRAGRDMNEGLE